MSGPRQAQPAAALGAEALLAEARKARENAYAPYSKFHVGAAVRASDGRIFHGCNVENASYGLTTCAERTAIFSAVAAGVREFDAIAVVTQAEESASEHDKMPCGACRQVMAEFMKRKTTVIIGVGASRDPIILTVDDLLPRAFSL